MKVAIVKYNAGNIQSVKFALNRIGIEPDVTDDPEGLKNADKVIFPGVGEASTAMRYLKEKNLNKLIPELQQPVLGICLGLQLMCASSEENNTEGMGIFSLKVNMFPKGKKIPQMGWNTLENLKGELFRGIREGAYVYFVHSYYAPESENTIATTDYIVKYSSALQKDNFYAVQFHPEKSGPVGAMILENFINL